MALVEYVPPVTRGRRPFPRATDLQLRHEETDEGTVFIVAGRGQPIATFCTRTADLELYRRLRPSERDYLAAHQNLSPRDLVTVWSDDPGWPFGWDD